MAFVSPVAEAISYSIYIWESSAKLLFKKRIERNKLDDMFGEVLYVKIMKNVF